MQNKNLKISKNYFKKVICIFDNILETFKKMLKKKKFGK